MKPFRNQTNTTPPPRDELYRLYVVEGKSCPQIAPLYGLTGHTIHHWLKRYDIPRRSVKEARALAAPPKYTAEGLRGKQIAAAEMRKHITEEARAKRAAKMVGREPPNKGKPMSEEQRQKLIAQRADPEYRRRQSERFLGEKSPMWKGGQKDEFARRLDRAEWRRIRQEVYARDNWMCADCGRKCKNTADSKNDGKAKIQAHHLVARRDGGSDDLSNLVTLCMSCHHKRERLAASAVRRDG